MKIFNFVLESKLDLHFNVKFEGESDGDGPESWKPYLDPLKFNGESKGDSPRAQKPYLHPYTIWHLFTRPLIGIKMKELNGKKIQITMCLFWLEARFAF